MTTLSIGPSGVSWQEVRGLELQILDCGFSI